MKLYINDNGDPSVGVRAQQWAIECPFEKGDMDPADLEHFRKIMQAAYVPYSEGRIWCAYDFELQESDEIYTELIDQPTEYDK